LAFAVVRMTTPRTQLAFLIVIGCALCTSGALLRGTPSSEAREPQEEQPEAEGTTSSVRSADIALLERLFRYLQRELKRHRLTHSQPDLSLNKFYPIRVRKARKEPVTIETQRTKSTIDEEQLFIG